MLDDEKKKRTDWEGIIFTIGLVAAGLMYLSWYLFINPHH